MEGGNPLLSLSNIKKKVFIIDYGMGNLFSVKSAFNYIGASAVISQDMSNILSYDYIILPGVGSFNRAMKRIKNLGIDDAIYLAIEKNNVKVLGICLGMQLLGKSSTEDGFANGLGLIDNPIEKIKVKINKKVKIPHIGFDRVKFHNKSNFFHNLYDGAFFYFVHSYRMLNQCDLDALATCSYEDEFVAAFQNGNIYGTQFHPEKSQSNGLQMLKNFLL